MRSVQDGESPESVARTLRGDSPRDVSVAGAVSSRRVERTEGEATGGSSAEIERQHAEVALQHRALLNFEWLVRRSGQAGTGYRQYPNEYLYETLGLHALPNFRSV